VIALETMACLLVVAACGGSSPSTPSPTAVQPLATGTQTQPPSSTPSPTVAASRAITGLFTNPQPLEATPRTIIIETTLPPWDGESVVFHNTLDGRKWDVGPGQGAIVSDDGIWGAWLYGDAARDSSYAGRIAAINLETGAVQWFAYTAFQLRAFDETGRLWFVSEQGDGRSSVLDLASGTVGTQAGPTFTTAPRVLPYRLYINGEEALSAAEGAWYPATYLGTEPDPRRATVVDARSGTVLYHFEAYQASPVDSATFLLATVPGETGESNIFLVDVETGTATFIATSIAGLKTWPLTASERYVLWMDGFCRGEPPWPVYLYHRQSGHIEMLDLSGSGDLGWSQVVLNPTGGGPGFVTVGTLWSPWMAFDLDSIRSPVRLPDEAHGQSGWWSRNYEWAIYDPFMGGHGSTC